MPRDELDDRYADDEFDPGFTDRPRRRPPGRRSNALAWVLGGLGCLTLLACGGVCGGIWWAVRPTDFPEETQDYSVARKAFRTTLTTTGPAPQGHLQLELAADAEAVEYTSGNLRLTAWASKPAGGKQPAVLYLHSGYAFDEKDWEETEPLRKAGFQVLTPMLRGENGQPGNFTLFCDEVGDVLAAADVLAKRPGVDPDRLYVGGYSSGGTLALLAGLADGRFKGCAAISPACDNAGFCRFASPEEVPFDHLDPAEIAIRSPLAWPKSVKCPTRLYIGTDELPAKLAADRFAAKARGHGKDVAVELLEGDHQEVVEPAVRRMVLFFQAVK
jgi:dienelactone hydrolase